MSDGRGRSGPGRTEYDAVVIGAGPNGLVAAVEVAMAGHRVLVLEAADSPGGGTRTEELTLDGFHHDVCSAIHPMGLASPALRDLPLTDHGVRWIHPGVPLAHPLDGGRAAVMEQSLDATADRLDAVAHGDGRAWRSVVGRVAESGFGLLDDLLDPISIPHHPIRLARFGLTGIQGATRVGRRRFAGDDARALLAGMAAHGLQPLGSLATTGYATLLGALGHLVGWPLVEGGSQRLADALVSIIEAHGGEVRCGVRVRSLADVPSATAVLADVTPRQLVAIAGDELPARYRSRLGRYRHGPGVFKVDWALDGPVPWVVPEVARAGTVHVGGTIDEIAAAEAEVGAGGHPDRPFVLVAQQSLFDPTRAPAGRQTLWGYCHVPNGSTVDMTGRIEAQIERFAPGFRDRILARHVMDTRAVEAHGINYVGGDINGGAADIRQYVTRPITALHPWRVPLPDLDSGWYLCSSSIPPGGGVHGMGGRIAARDALRRHLRP